MMDCPYPESCPLAHTNHVHVLANGAQNNAVEVFDVEMVLRVKMEPSSSVEEYVQTNHRLTLQRTTNIKDFIAEVQRIWQASASFTAAPGENNVTNVLKEIQLFRMPTATPIDINSTLPLVHLLGIGDTSLLVLATYTRPLPPSQPTTTSLPEDVIATITAQVREQLMGEIMNIIADANKRKRPDEEIDNASVKRVRRGINIGDGHAVDDHAVYVEQNISNSDNINANQHAIEEQHSVEDIVLEQGAPAPPPEARAQIPTTPQRNTVQAINLDDSSMTEVTQPFQSLHAQDAESMDTDEEERLMRTGVNLDVKDFTSPRKLVEEHEEEYRSVTSEASSSSESEEEESSGSDEDSVTNSASVEQEPEPPISSIVKTEPLSSPIPTDEPERSGSVNVVDAEPSISTEADASKDSDKETSSESSSSSSSSEEEQSESSSSEEDSESSQSSQETGDMENSGQAGSSDTSSKSSVDVVDEIPQKDANADMGQKSPVKSPRQNPVRRTGQQSANTASPQMNTSSAGLARLSSLAQIASQLRDNIHIPNAEVEPTPQKKRTVVLASQPDEHDDGESSSSSSSESESESEQEATPATQEEPKRGRGRPKKTDTGSKPNKRRSGLELLASDELMVRNRKSQKAGKATTGKQNIGPKSPTRGINLEKSPTRQLSQQILKSPTRASTTKVTSPAQKVTSPKQQPSASRQVPTPNKITSLPRTIFSPAKNSAPVVAQNAKPNTSAKSTPQKEAKGTPQKQSKATPQNAAIKTTANGANTQRTEAGQSAKQQSKGAKGKQTNKPAQAGSKAQPQPPASTKSPPTQAANAPNTQPGSTRKPRKPRASKQKSA